MTARVDESVTVAKCCNSHPWVIEDSGSICPSCAADWVHTRYTTRIRLEQNLWKRDIHGGPSPNVFTFKPYRTADFTGEDISVENRGQRDGLCSEHGLTYDGCRYLSKPRTPSAIDSIDYGDVKAALEDPSFLSEFVEPDIPNASFENGI